MSNTNLISADHTNNTFDLSAALKRDLRRYMNFLSFAGYKALEMKITLRKSKEQDNYYARYIEFKCLEYTEENPEGRTAELFYIYGDDHLTTPEGEMIVLPGNLDQVMGCTKLDIMDILETFPELKGKDQITITREMLSREEEKERQGIFDEIVCGLLPLPERLEQMNFCQAYRTADGLIAFWNGVNIIINDLYRQYIVENGRRLPYICERREYFSHHNAVWIENDIICITQEHSQDIENRYGYIYFTKGEKMVQGEWEDDELHLSVYGESVNSVEDVQFYY